MCTVTFIPLVANEFVLTSSRDEHINRAPSNTPQIMEYKGMELLAPIDGKAGGTWISASNEGRLVCLLNGGFEKHKHTPPYRKSRGVVLLESFEWDEFSDFSATYNLDNIEPFTLIVVEPLRKKLQEFRWDGKQTHLKNLAYENHIWSSATLYDKTIRNNRLSWFNEWFNENENSINSAKNFHINGGKGTIENNFLMKRASGIQTVSITQVVFEQSNYQMIHDNFATKKLSEKEIKINSNETV